MSDIMGRTIESIMRLRARVIENQARAYCDATGLSPDEIELVFVRPRDFGAEFSETFFFRRRPEWSDWMI